jgi:hypothetical protein
MGGLNHGHMVDAAVTRRAKWHDIFARIPTAVSAAHDAMNVTAGAIGKRRLLQAESARLVPDGVFFAFGEEASVGGHAACIVAKSFTPAAIL